MSNTIQHLKLYLHTIRYLKLKQIFWRLFYQLKKPKLSSQTTPPLNLPLHAWQQSIDKAISILSPTRFKFLNTEHEINEVNSWNNSEFDKLWLYNLHYFDDLNTKDNKQKFALHQQLILRWIAENPVGKGIGWQPYPLSLRIVNWIKWNLNGNSLTLFMLDNLAIQVRFLNQKIEYHLFGNHLIANAKALIFAGLFFKNSEALRWLKKGLKILNQQIDEQILTDGGHFERSTMYHAIVLEDLLDIINICNTYNLAISKLSNQIIQKMLFWLEAMSHTDGEIALFNDAALKIAARFEQLKNYAERLNIIYKNKLLPSNLFSHSGYARFSKKDIDLLIDIAPLGPDYLPAHGHADTFTFELALHQQRVIVNSGTSCYGTSAERQRQRGTAAHNTVMIDRQNSSQIWAGFRVGKRAKIRNIKFENNSEAHIISAQHTGYQYLTKKVIHQRTWNLTAQSLQIHDELIGNNDHEILLSFHFHPDVFIHTISSHVFLICDKMNNPLAILELDSLLQSEIVASTYHPEFGKTISNKKITATTIIKLPFNVVTQFRLF